MTFRRRIATVVTIAVSFALLSACGSLQDVSQSMGGGTPAKASAAPASATPTESVLDSQFTKDGTFQSHIDIDGVDFVYTIWPTKSTPRTNEWYARGDKFFSFSLTAYDLDRDLRDKFKTKRKVYLDNIRVSSHTTTSGSGEPESPYALDATASRITLDPEPVRTKHGMLITSPKGAFELRNQRIGELRTDAVGVTLVFEASVNVQQGAHSSRYRSDTIRQEVPISIFPSDKATKVTKIPIDAN